jgi:hypothetical protein
MAMAKCHQQSNTPYRKQGRKHFFFEKKEAKNFYSSNPWPVDSTAQDHCTLKQ